MVKVTIQAVRPMAREGGPYGRAHHQPPNGALPLEGRLPEPLAKEPDGVDAPDEGEEEEAEVEVGLAKGHLLLRGHLGALQVHPQLATLSLVEVNQAIKA